MNVFDYEVLDTIREYQVSEGDFPSIFKGREEEALSSLKKISAYGLVYEGSDHLWVRGGGAWDAGRAGGAKKTWVGGSMGDAGADGVVLRWCGPGRVEPPAR